MARYDIFGKTEGMRRQVQDLILTAYRKGYKDGEFDEQDRKLEMLLKERKGKWIKQSDPNSKLFGWYTCSECGAFIGEEPPYCSNCGAKMEN